ncbi:MAG: radical SAM family heme chaperone HemW [Lachnospiraceae bacterium]|nr:radical SAM family heme chaperone HemW [Lachnospiraceae bacterium]
MRELSIYIHIPFCVRKCLYCDFLSGKPKGNSMSDYAHALINEIKNAGAYAKDFTVETVFIGGGTPSIYGSNVISDIINTLRDAFESVRKGSFAPSEVTMECNPGTVDVDKLILYKKCGINRISLGLQSANYEELKMLGRIHRYEDWVNSVISARKAGFDNINVDLMSGLPGQSRESFADTLRKVLEYETEHISVYSLIVEENTPFYNMYNPDNMTDEQYDEWEREDRAIYDMTYDTLLSHGYRQYEISNYAKPGFACKHNLVYWNRGDYLGLGLGSSSMIGDIRFKNCTSLKKYMDYYSKSGAGAGTRLHAASLPDTLYMNTLHEDVQKLTGEEQMSEHVMLGLRKTEGIDIHEFDERYNADFMNQYREQIKKWTDAGMLEFTQGRICCTRRGLSVSNAIIVDFM